MSNETENKAPKTFAQRVNEKIEALSVAYTAKRQFETSQRKNGNFMRDALQRAIDVRTVRLMAPWVNVMAERQMADTCHQLGLVLPAPEGAATQSVKDGGKAIDA